MLVVIPVCEKDVEAALRNIEHCLTLDGKCNFKAIVSSEIGFPVQSVLDSAARYFSGVDHCLYDPYKGDPAWPRPQNWAWQNTARWIETKYRTPWFWWEQDAVVIKPGAFESIFYAHKAGKRLCSAAVTQQMGQFYATGVSVYPWDVSNYFVNALLTQAESWDKMASFRDGILKRTHDITPLICHIPDRDNIHFTSRDEVSRIIPDTAVIFHKCKDGSLISVLNGKGELQDVNNSTPSASKPVSKHDYPSFTEQTSYQCGYFTFPTQLNTTCFYNCSIVDNHGQKLLFTRRHRHRIFDPMGQLSDNCSDLAIWKVRDNMTVESTPILPLVPQRHKNEQWEDPRALLHNDVIYISFSNWVHNKPWPGRQSFTKLTHDMRKVEVLYEPAFGGNAKHHENQTMWEKNWIWFPHSEPDDSAWWHCIYSINPHVIFKVNIDGDPIQTYSNKPLTMEWEFGEPRGGTPPIQINEEEYLCFFHSALMWQKPKRRYFMGAYTFRNKPPFEVLRMTSTPLLVGSEYDFRVLGSPLVIFPNGALPEFDSQGNIKRFLVVFGVNDEHCGWMKIPFKAVEENLKHIGRKRSLFSMMKA